MMIHTLTPNQNLLALTTVGMLSSGSFVIPLHVQRRIATLITDNLIKIHVWVKAFIVLFGLMYISPLYLFSFKLAREGLSLVVGMLVGLIFVASAIFLHRYLARKKSRTDRRFSRTVASNDAGWKKYFTQISLYELLVIAVSEEFIFRGFLVYFAFYNADFLSRIIILCGANFIFGFSHITMGWLQVIEKLIFGFLLLFLTLLTGTITGAIVAHCILNAKAWGERQW